jgi:5-formyltetrahydrofolate cyclo-ligase
VTGKLQPPASPNAIRSLKANLRKQIFAARDALSAGERHALSERITMRLLALKPYRAARCVMAYCSFGSEFDTAALLADALAHGKRLALPRVDGAARAIRVHEVRDPRRELVSGAWGIREPRADRCPEVPREEIGFVLVPGVAFTWEGARLGYGKGYYDALIRDFGPVRPALVAAAFSVQLVPELPVSETDQRVDLVVTESGEYRGGDR